MGKNSGSMTAAAISKRMKAKGLGRLRWYCQMCEKQCRDENGFKCHTQSAGHQRQLGVFAENPSDFIHRFSDTFRKQFLLVLRRRYGTEFVSANTVYQEYIKDRDHLHMNATKWTTLSGFAKEMGREGHCRVQEREDGWWLSFVDREAAEKDKKARDMDRLRVAEEQRAEAVLQQQLVMARRINRSRPREEPDPLEGTVDEGPILMEIKVQNRTRRTIGEGEENVLASLSSSKGGLGEEKGKQVKRRSRWQDAPKLSALEEIMRNEKSMAQAKAAAAAVKVDEKRASSEKPVTQPGDVPAQEEAWIADGIIVKITSKEVGDGAFYKSKGKIVNVIAEYGARVELIDSDTLLELDQDDLETVIPKPGGRVLLLRGAHRGKKATVTNINFDSYSVDLELANSGQDLTAIDYEAVSRLAD